MKQADLDMLCSIFGAENVVVLDEIEVQTMKGQVVKAMADKRFGFIKGNDGVQYFFHQSDVYGFFDDLVEDVAKGHKPEVVFQIAPSTKGPRASEVTRLDGGVTPTD